MTPPLYQTWNSHKPHSSPPPHPLQCKVQNKSLCYNTQLHLYSYIIHIRVCTNNRRSEELPDFHRTEFRLGNVTSFANIHINQPTVYENHSAHSVPLLESDAGRALVITSPDYGPFGRKSGKHDVEILSFSLKTKVTKLSCLSRR